jgi:RND superfamily putative drug exporter
MISVFGSFVLGVDRSIKLFGLGLAVAVLFDATIVRMVLVPATMDLLGDRNRWLPGWLDPDLPQLKVDVTDHDDSSSGEQNDDDYLQDVLAG